MAETHLLEKEAVIVIRLGVTNGVVVGIEGLDNYLALLIGPPRPATNLAKEVKGPLASTKVRQA